MTLENGLRPDRPGQARRLHLLLAAQPGLADDRQPDRRRLQPDQPLHAQRGRHRGRAGLRARDPAGAEGEDLRQPGRLPRRPEPTTAPATSAAPGWTSTPTATSTSASATTCRRTRPVTTATRRWTTAPRSAGTRARPSANSADLRGKILRIHAAGRHRRRAPSRASTRRTRSRRATCSRPGTAKTRPGDLRDGLPPAVHGAGGPGEPRHRRRRRVLPRQQRQQRRRARPPASASGTSSTSPASWAGRSAWATTRRPTRTFRWNYAGERDDRPAVRLLARRACRPTSAGRPTGADAGRADVRRPRHAARPGEARDGLEEVRRRDRRPVGGRLRRPDAPAACRRSPARSTATTRTRPSRAPSRRTTTARGSSPTAATRAASGRRSASARTTTRCCASTTGRPPRQFGSSPTNPVIPSRFGPDGALYMARWDNGCCRNELGADTGDAAREDRVQRPGRVPDRHAAAEHEPRDRGPRAPERGGHLPRGGHLHGDRG